ncbi:type I restriction endonuclease [Scytonema sp. PRP1]
MDWQPPTNNDFFLASQFWIAGEMYTRRTDLIGFVNGIPLIFIELKASRERVELPTKTTSATTEKKSPNCSGTTASSCSPALPEICEPHYPTQPLSASRVLPYSCGFGRF